LGAASETGRAVEKKQKWERLNQKILGKNSFPKDERKGKERKGKERNLCPSTPREVK
jgi:hypothetical protein